MKQQHGEGKLFPLIIGSLGVVFGDIGTSPLYAIKECFDPKHGMTLNESTVIGVLSLIIWSMISVITIKYASLVMRASNNGQGGILALLALASRRQIYRSQTLVKYVVPTGLFGAALLYGDAIITPSISVVSALEGINVATPVFAPYVLPLSFIVLTFLFAIQKIGTGGIGRIFGPVMIVWFTTLAVTGVYQIFHNWTVLKAFNPYYAIEFLMTNGFVAFVVLGSVFLVVTGGEALYADMGHFGRSPIRKSWSFVVFPSLVLNYLGQGAYLISNPEGVTNPFYKMAPQWGLVPLVVLATAASVIASQALISGVFSLTRQAMQLGYLPRLRVVHTSSQEIGQIYVPVINWMLYVAVLFLVTMFRTSSNMASAYGVAIATTMVITTTVLYFVARKKWGWTRMKSIFVVGPFLVIDGAFLGSNLLKIPDGGWFPLAIGVFFFVLMTTWRKGRHILAQRMRTLSEPTEQFLSHIKRDKPVRVPGIAFFLTSDPEGVPPCLLHNMKHNKVLHEKVVLLTMATKEVPYQPVGERVTVEDKGEGIFRIVATYGFMESPNINDVLLAAGNKGVKIDPQAITYFLGRETILPSKAPGMAIWRETIFSIMSKNAERAITFFRIPPDQVIEVGLQIEI